VLATRYRRFGPRLTVSLSDEDHDKLHRLAEKDEVSISWVIRRAIVDYLRRHSPPGGVGQSRPPPAIPRRQRRST
jgi:hypothetical protein